MNRVSPPGARSIDRLQVVVQTRPVRGSKFARSRPRSVSLNSLDYRLQVHLQPRSITVSKYISNLAWLRAVSSHNHGLQVHFQTRSITSSKCISKLVQLQHPKFARSWRPSAFPYLLDHCLGVYVWVDSIVIFRHTSNSFQSLPAANPDIWCVDG